MQSTPITTKLWVWFQLKRGVLDTTLCDKVCQWHAAGQWFSPGTQISSNKTDCHHITEILLKVTLSIITLTSISICWFQNCFVRWAFTDCKYSIFHLILYIYFRWTSAESRWSLVQCSRGLQGQIVTRKMEFSYTTSKNYKYRIITVVKDKSDIITVL